MNNGDIPITIFLDLSKAFDTLNHSILLDKLKHCGIRDCALNLLNSYLSDRQQFVQINNIKSSLPPVKTQCATRIYSWPTFIPHISK